MKFVVGLEELNKVVEALLKTISSGVVILEGDLAAGKTTFVQYVAKYLEIEDEVTSPTFSLQQSYGDKIFHYDIYNHGLEHFLSLGMLEELEKDALHFVEWGDESLVKLLESVGIDVVTLKIKKIADNKREYEICTH